MQLNPTEAHSIILASAFLLALFLEGCGSQVPKPVAEMTSAEIAISQAEYTGAKDYAPVDLDRANTKLSEGFKEFNEANYRKAMRLFQEALVDAHLAEAKATAAKAINATQAMEESVLVLEERLKINQTR